MINLLRLKLNKKYYRKDEVDALFKELNNKIDNLNILSKEEIQDMIDRKTKIIDPPPFGVTKSEIIYLIKSIIDSEAMLKIDYDFMTDKKINAAIDALANRIKTK
jgi:DNA topoisomerase VI subunit B